MVKVSIQVPLFLRVNERKLNQALNRVGGRLATKVRKALRGGKTYEGAALPSGATDELIDLNDTGALIKSVKYSARLKEIGAFGPHPTASKRAGGAYGLMRILQSGKGRNKVEVRDSFDAFGTDGDRTKIIDEATAMLDDEIEKLGIGLFTK